MGSEMCIRDRRGGARDGLRRARLVRERQSRETADRMERTQSTDVDASTWADEHRHKVRGHDGRHGRRDTQREHAFIEEVRRRPGNKRDRLSPTGSRRQSRSRSRSRSPHQQRTSTSGGGITGTLSGFFTSAQEAIGASWAAATAEGEIPTRRTASISARTTPSKQSAQTPPGGVGAGQTSTHHQPIQKGPPPSGGGTPAAPLQRAAWRTSKHRQQGPGRAQNPG